LNETNDACIEVVMQEKNMRELDDQSSSLTENPLIEMENYEKLDEQGITQTTLLN
jgi:hypothetical protein